MTFRDKVGTFEGVYGKRTPSAWRALWRLGLQVPPPWFLTTWQVALYAGLTFAAFSWVILAVSKAAVGVQVALPVFNGVCFGTLTARAFHREARALNLPRWREYMR